RVPRDAVTHAVDAGCEPPELIPASHLDGGPVVAGRNARNSTLESMDRTADDDLHEHDDQDRGHEKREDRDDTEGQLVGALVTDEWRQRDLDTDVPSERAPIGSHHSGKAAGDLLGAARGG